MKIDFDDKTFAAKLLLMRMKEKQEKEEKMCNSMQEKEAEMDCLFYWILSRMYAKMDSFRPAKKTISIRITGSLTRYNKVLLEHGKSDDYVPFYVAGKDFFDVVKDTIEIFDNFDNFNAVYFQSSDETCEINVYMSI
jgi:DNA/RNA endonuclease YhcR with UshA esterase domain